MTPAAPDGDTAWLTTLLDLARLLGEQRTALETRDYEALDTVTMRLERAYAAIEALVGSDRLAALLQQADAPARDAAMAALERAAVDNRVNGELVRIAMHRVAAMRAASATAHDAATYRPDGGSTPAGGRLSRRA